MTGSAVGRVNTRFLLLAFILAGLSAVLAYVALSGSGGESSSGAGISVVVATSDIESGTTIEASMLTLKEFSTDNVPALTFSDGDLVVGSVARQLIPAQGLVLGSSLANSSAGFVGEALTYIIPEGMRGMAITTTTLVGAGGLILPGDRVDIYFMPASSEDQLEEDQVGAMLIAENIEVLAVQTTLVDIAPTAPGLEGEETGEETVVDERVRGSDADANIEATTFTLLLTPAESARVFCAESSGSLRLAARALGDKAVSGQTAVCVLRAEEELVP
jgi:Flp pilus assembly protein CpaB